MKTEQIHEEVKKIKEIAEDRAFHPGSIADVSPGPNNFNHGWLVNNIKNYHSAHSIHIDSLEDVIEIIHLFSDTSKEEVSRNVHDKQKHLFEFINGDDNYLHYIKSLKV